MSAWGREADARSGGSECPLSTRSRHSASVCFRPIADIGLADDNCSVSDAAIFLWPLFGLFSLAAAGASWQASNPGREIAAKEKILARDWRLPRWQKMPLWGGLRAQQQDAARFAKSASRRAKMFAASALATLVYLLIFD